MRRKAGSNRPPEKMIGRRGFPIMVRKPPVNMRMKAMPPKERNPHGSFPEIHEKAMDYASEGITISDMRLPDEPLVYANAGFERLTGYSRAEILGKNCRFLQGGASDDGNARAIRGAIREGREHVCELLNYRKDGSPFWNRLSLTPLRDESGAVTHYIGIQTDITERVLADGRLQETLAKLEEANRKLESANRRMRQSLNAAAKVQQALLPRKIPQCRRIEFAWRMRSCDELAGDILNVFRLDDNHFGVYLLDVTGHGVASALRAVAASQMLSADLYSASLLWEQCETTGGYCLASPAAVADKLNRHFQWDPEVGLFFTLVYGILDFDTLKFRYVSAGHPPPLHFSGGNERAVAASPGLPVGLNDEPFRENELQMTPGDVLVLYSDGITDAMNPEKTLFGRGRLAECFTRAWHEPLEATMDEIMRSLAGWRGNTRFDDDLSMLAFRVRE